jgi:formate hydrogenlyase subunit 3/multisubunit Na+/H+ antiporter MnhD subunit
MPPAWWGWGLIVIGITSGILGVLFALAQHDLKRLLAYHSVENIGIIALGLGLGLLGMSIRSPALTVLGFAGGLLHVLNHALFKGLLFLGAGAVVHETGTREIDHLGGLLKRMPFTGICFLVGAAAISGLPPLNGFISEFLIYLGAFRGIGVGVPVFLATLMVIAALALIGGLAAACFAKAFGIVFLGEPRTQHCDHAHEVGILMRLPMIVLAAGCFLIGLSGPFVIQIFSKILPVVTGLPEQMVQARLDEAVGPLMVVLQMAVILSGFIGIMTLLRRRLLVSRVVKEAVTWDCGYAAPSPRMQYTASSFAQPLTDFFGAVLRRRRRGAQPEGNFPKSAAFSTEMPDLFQQRLFRPAFDQFYNYAQRTHFFQHGRLQIYILYIIATLLVLFVWKMW